MNKLKIIKGLSLLFQTEVKNLRFYPTDKTTKIIILIITQMLVYSIRLSSQVCLDSKLWKKKKSLNFIWKQSLRTKKIRLRNNSLNLLKNQNNDKATSLEWRKKFKMKNPIPSKFFPINFQLLIIFKPRFIKKINQPKLI